MGLPNVARHSPEILAVRRGRGADLLIVQMPIAGQVHRFEIPVDARGARIMRQVLQMRPFEDLPSVTYRYFFSGGYSQQQGKFFRFHVWIQQGRDHGSFWIEPKGGVPGGMMWGLVWLHRLGWVERGWEKDDACLREALTYLLVKALRARVLPGVEMAER
jgi:hypothetical protein